MGHDEGGPLDALHHVGHGERLAGARDAEEHLIRHAFQYIRGQLFDGLRLVARGLIGRI